MNSLPLMAQYTQEVLAWQLGQKLEVGLPVEDRARARETAERVARLAARAQHRHVVVLGLGDGTLGHMLAALLPPQCQLVVLEDNPHRARAVQAGCPSLPYALLVDSSPWALLLLCMAVGIKPERCLVCHNPVEGPALSPLGKWRRLFMGSGRLRMPEAGSRPCPELSVACIAHPEEDLLAEFFAHIPPWVKEVVVIWDGAAPAQVPPCPVPLRQQTRPLNGNFALQRNAMLELCEGSWCLYLDVDERLAPESWQALQAWMHLPDVGGIMLPRQTFMGDVAHVRMGYGLWPDMQVRLFPLRPGLSFVGAVHEKLTGLQGRLLLAGGLSLLHYSHVRKSPALLKARLQVFDCAAGTGSPGHVLSAAYPRLPVSFFTQVRGLLGPTCGLVLPAMG